MTDTAYSAGVSHESLMGQIADEYMNRLNRGERVEIDEYVERYPQLATYIRQVFPAFRVMRVSASEMDSSGQATELEASTVGRLGDYRIIREVGRGGMGIVYEAEQVSLGRRVALKVLPFAAVLDAKQLQRFKNEAQAAAQLHHTNIVPVFSVGCECGVHYYAMQYIEGSTLGDVIHELRQVESPDASGSARRPSPTSRPVANRSHSGSVGPPRPTSKSENLELADSGAAQLPEEVPAAEGSSAALEAIAPEHSTKSPAFFRSVANLGVQAAEALEHAHELGVVHRDIKPSNLLLDTRGNLWITDFGLARLESDPGLTMTGDVLGTVRYMSPEQALGKHLLLDHRTDIYSLGVTLYELLTLKPALDGRDRQELMRRIADEDPRLPRRLNDAIPADLETIVLKATAKEPERRYATAKNLAEDLQRFLLDKPIQAKRPTLLERASKWSRRHRHLVASAVVVLVLAVVGLSVSTVLIWQEQARTASERNRATREARAAEEINNFFNSMLAAVDPVRLRRYSGFAPEHTELPTQTVTDGGRKVSVAEMLELVADPEEIKRRFAGKPDLEARAREAIGMTFQSLSRPADAELHLRAALAIRSRTLGDDHPDTLRTKLQIAYLLWNTRRSFGGNAEELARSAYDGMKRNYGDDHRVTLTAARVLATVLTDQLNYDESEQLYSDALQRQTELFGEADHDRLATMLDWAVSSFWQRKLSRWSRLITELHDICERELDPDDPLSIRARVDMGFQEFFWRYNDFGHKRFQEGVEACARVFGEDHHWYYYTKLLYGATMPLEQREEIYWEVLDGLEQNYGKEQFQTLQARGYYLPAVLVEQSRFDEAIHMAKGALQSWLRLREPTNPSVVIQQYSLIGALVRAGRLEEARQLTEQYFEMARALVDRPDVHTDIALIYSWLLHSTPFDDLRDVRELWRDGKVAGAV
ncbi:MAG: protein kinase, partial [Phycisphaerae bacterium]